MENAIIGRKKEKMELEKYIASDQSEFIAIYGRRRVGCSWTYRPSQTLLNDPEADEDLKSGGQIDLLIDRNDKTISVCEMKYASGEYEIT